MCFCKTKKVKSHSHHIISTMVSIDFWSHVCQVFVVFVRILHCKITFSPLFILPLRKRQTARPTLIKQEVIPLEWEGFTSLRAEVLCKFVRTILLRRFVYSFHLFIQPFIAEWIHVYLLHTVGYNPILLYLIHWSNIPALAIDGSLKFPPMSLEYNPNIMDFLST